MPSILFVFTSADKTVTGAPTGWYLPEAAHPYYILAPHATIDFAAPKGPNPPLDQGSKEAFAKDDGSVRFLNDEAVIQKFASAKTLSEVSVKDYDAIFYIGVHGPVIDLAFDKVNAKLATDFWQAGKIVSAVCHGPAALVEAVDVSGESIFRGRKVAGLSNKEERLLDTVKEVPFLLEDKIVALGGNYESAEPWGVKVVVDGKLITGQNPSSSSAIGEAILKALTS